MRSHRRRLALAVEIAADLVEWGDNPDAATAMRRLIDRVIEADRERVQMQKQLEDVERELREKLLRFATIVGNCQLGQSFEDRLQELVSAEQRVKDARRVLSGAEPEPGEDSFVRRIGAAMGLPMKSREELLRHAAEYATLRKS